MVSLTEITLGQGADLKEINQEFSFRHIGFDIPIRYLTGNCLCTPGFQEKGRYWRCKFGMQIYPQV